MKRFSPPFSKIIIRLPRVAKLRFDEVSGIIFLVMLLL